MEGKYHEEDTEKITTASALSDAVVIVILISFC
jgi:hypothetical protein